MPCGRKSGVGWGRHFSFLERSGFGEDLQTRNPPVSAKLMISYSCPLSASGYAPCGGPWRRCNAVLRAALDTGWLSVGRWLRWSLSKMFFLARSRSSFRWLSRSKAGSPHARHWLSALGVATVARARNRKTRSNEEIIAGGGPPWAIQLNQSHKPGAQGLKSCSLSSLLAAKDLGKRVYPAGMTSCCRG